MEGLRSCGRRAFATLFGVLCLLLPHGAAAADAPPAPCRVSGIKHEVRCGRLARPLDPGRPTGPSLELHYVVVPATAVNKQPDPLFFFAGGPGQSAIALAGNLLPQFARLNNRRDLVFIDQRGTGRSAPLECASDEALPLAQRLDTERAIARLRDCLNTLQQQPLGDLRFYTTTIAMADADAVRRALGAARINLVGGSYGTRAALEYLRQFPHAVRRVVIDGVAPPDMLLPVSMGADVQAALDALFAACAAEPACAARHPQLREHWQALLDTLPRDVELTDPADGRPARVVLTREALAGAVRGPLYAPALAAALPYAIGEAHAGRYGPIVGLAGSLGGGGRANRIYEGMHFAVVCAEDGARFERAPQPLVAPFGEAMAAPYRRLCGTLPRANVPEAFYRVPPSPAPVLAFSGTLDPVTPPRHGERMLQALGAKARHVVVSNVGHGVMGIGCARDLVHRFIDAEDEAQALAVDGGCLGGIPRPPAYDPPRANGVGAAPAGAAAR